MVARPLRYAKAPQLRWHRARCGCWSVAAGTRDHNVSLAAEGGEVVRLRMGDRDGGVGEQQGVGQRGSNDPGAADDNGVATRHGHTAMLEQL